MSTLQKHWQRHDWQRSPFAPKLHIVQALTGGKTASGAGFSRYNAMARCLGETAEILALAEGESSEGVAAGPSLAFARAAALKERLERWALWDWWHGQLEAVPLAADLVAVLRAGARESRETALWHLPDFPHCEVVIARSLDGTHGQPILGFGANTCPVAAARSALVELGLMEMNLLSPRPGLAAYFKRLGRVEHSHFPAGKAAEAVALSPRAGDTLERRLTIANTVFSFADLTPKGCPLTVIRAEIPDAPRWGRTPGPLA